MPHTGTSQKPKLLCDAMYFHIVTTFFFAIILKGEKQECKREKSYYPLLQNNLDTYVSVTFSSFLFHQGIVNVHCGSLKIICV